jgi:hypothetical protein
VQTIHCACPQTRWGEPCSLVCRCFCQAGSSGGRHRSASKTTLRKKPWHARQLSRYSRLCCRFLGQVVERTGNSVLMPAVGSSQSEQPGQVDVTRLSTRDSVSNTGVCLTISPSPRQQTMQPCSHDRKQTIGGWRRAWRLRAGGERGTNSAESAG